MGRFKSWKALSMAFLLVPLARPCRAVEKALPPLSCKTIEGLDPLLRKGQILLLGEMHGTNEIPAFMADVTCRALRTGAPVTVALEVPTEEEPRVAAYLASPGRAEDRAALLAGPFWRDPFQDGRRSQGMLSLLEDLRRLRQAGSPLKVKLLDRLPQGPGRDRVMAGELESAVKASPGDLFIVVTGNVHSRTVPGTPWDPKLENMGYLIAQHHPGVVALDAAYSGGTVWMCTQMDPASCGAKPVHGTKGAGQAPSVRMYDKVNLEGFSGEYYVGALTASPPANPQRDAVKKQP